MNYLSKHIPISIAFVDTEIDKMLYDKAIENIQDNEWIESEVERFRKELILSRYESDLHRPTL